MRAGLGQEGDHGRADREVLELAELLDAIERVDLRVVRDVEQGLRADMQVLVVERFFHGAVRRRVARFIQHADGLAAHFLGWMREQPAHGRMHRVVAPGAEHAQGIEHFRRVSAIQLLREHFGCAAVETSGGRALRIETIVLDRQRAACDPPVLQPSRSCRLLNRRPRR